jgi:hypothetical protein
MTTRQDYNEACKVIEAHNPTAWGISQHGDDTFSARIGHMIAYYVIINNKIIGDIWYE